MGPWRPLHILDPDRVELWPWFATLAALLGLWWWMRRLWRRSVVQGASASARGRPTLSSPKPSAGEQHVIERLREHFSRSGELRQGCHALARGLRIHLARASNEPVTRWTVAEIEERVKVGAAPQIFDLLAGLQFRQREPESSEFDNICDLVRAEMGTKPRLSWPEVLEPEPEFAGGTAEEKGRP